MTQKRFVIMLLTPFILAGCAQLQHSRHTHVTPLQAQCLELKHQLAFQQHPNRFGHPTSMPTYHAQAYRRYENKQCNQILDEMGKAKQEKPAHPHERGH